MADQTSCEVLIIGGGLAGAALGRALAQAGVDVLIAEKETAFRDRVRGEVLLPWGSVEAQALGIYDLLLESCGREFLCEADYLEGVTGEPRDYRSTTPHHTCGLTFQHPEMQEVMLRAAGEAGATIWRNASIVALEGGPSPCAKIIQGSTEHVVNCELIVGADGRESRVATLAGFDRKRDAEHLMTGGLQFQGAAAVPPHLHFFLDNAKGRGAIWIETRPCTHRAYILHHKDAIGRRLSGERDFATVVEHFHSIGVPQDWLASAKPFGLFATFDGAHRWIDNPCREGIVLLGDAASCSDPVWGNGLSRTLRDVRLLRDRLLGEKNWNLAITEYAHAHDDAFQRLRRVERLCAELYFSMGTEAALRRDRAWKYMEDDPQLRLDMAALGPEANCSDDTIQKLLGPPH